MAKATFNACDKYVKLVYDYNNKKSWSFYGYSRVMWSDRTKDENINRMITITGCF